MAVYVVCQTSKCQQTYPLAHFGEVTKDTKNVKCEKCGGVLIDENGRANFSQNPDVRPVIKVEELEAQRKAELKVKHQELARLKKAIRALENEDY